ncbi:MAG: ATP-binding cassette domain-containing protein, partial [Oscillospiraceae bacterium]|nr:ATP-binding cassette domain-containing protein [Oscillospiraceae bacterium]
MSEAMLSVKDLSVSYGSIHAVKNISFEVKAGEIVTLIGANGAGKSTTLNAIARLLPASGEILFHGSSLMHVPGHSVVKKGLAMVPEGRRIFLRMSVEENLEMGAYISSRTEVKEQMEDV